MQPVTEQQLRQLLLRRLPDDEASRLEAAILLDAGVAERLRVLEFDLFDDYAAGQLNAADRDDMDRHLLSHVEGRESLRLARALIAQRERRPRSAVAAVAGRRFGMQRFAPVAALLAAGLAAVIVIPAWLSRPHPPLANTAAPAVARSDAPLAAMPPFDAASALPAQVLTLVAEVDRGAGLQSLPVDAAVATVRLQVEVPGPQAGRYFIAVEDAAGRRLFTGPATPSQSVGRYRFIETLLPRGALAPGARTISLRAAGLDGGLPPAFRWQVIGVLEPASKKDTPMP